MFDSLPLHIKKTIFALVKYIDLFETARVSQEWWALTMASFERHFHEADDFLLDQVEFCNQMMPKEETWEWWMLMEFTKSTRLHLKGEYFIPMLIGPEPQLIDYYKAKGVSVRHLILDFYVVSDRVHCYSRCPANLDELFPDLTSITLFNAKFDDGKSLIFPKKLKHVRLSRVEFKLAAYLSDIFPDPRMLKVLEIGADDTLNLVFDSVQFLNLTYLSLYVPNLSPNNLTKAAPILKRLVGECEMLKSVSLDGALITKEWFKILPSRVVNISLKWPLLDVDVQTVFGEHVFYDRLLLMYICQNWTTVVLFNSQYLGLKARRVDGVGLNFGGTVKDLYDVGYVCRPTQMEEEIYLETMQVKTDIKKLITENNEGLVLTKLDCKILAEGQNYATFVPKTVRDFSLVVDYCENFNVEDLFEDCSVVEKLKLYEEEPNVNGRVTGFPRMVDLRQLEINRCDCNQLASILQLCPLLEKLTLKEPEEHAFADICDHVTSESVKSVTIIKGNDSIDDILKALTSLQSLTLVDPPSEALLESDFEKVNRLKYFKAYCDRNNEIAPKFACLRFPCMIFACTTMTDYYLVCQGSTVMNEINDALLENNVVGAIESFFLDTNCDFIADVLIMFAEGISVQFLRNRYPVVFSIEEFCEKLSSFN